VESPAVRCYSDFANGDMERSGTLPKRTKGEAMARFSRGVRPDAIRDLRRILDASAPEQRPETARVARQLLEELAEDPHEQGEPRPQSWSAELRVRQVGPLRMYFAVRSVDDRYVEVIGFSLI
jgi:hypothetical protein